jgi:hypothetical protein
MNTRSARERNMFAPTLLSRNWREQRPSNKGDLESSVRVGREYYISLLVTLALSDCCIAFEIANFYLRGRTDSTVIFQWLSDFRSSQFGDNVSLV